ncbi:MAG: dual specificity protein phosphatase family protein [Planctomycetales bacterium]|nr:dual specificity protein phosphatase family protein [Planctomycetales bacterium]
MTEVLQNSLWLGNAMDIRDSRRLFDLGIEAVVDVAAEEPPAQLPRQMIYCRFPLNDGTGNNPFVLRQTVQTIVDCLVHEKKTVVACSAGMSRSPTVSAFAIGVFMDRNPEEIVAEIAMNRSLEINRLLWSDVATISQKVVRQRT